MAEAKIEILFYNLLRVAIGTSDRLSHTPSNKEWNALYDMAKKQSLVGVCFAGLQRLGADADEGFARIGMSEMLYLTWMGMAAKIHQKNQTVDEQCVILGERLKAEGYRCCILKGQGLAQLYADSLRSLRQSGDIDVWISGSREKTLAYVQKISPTNEVTWLHTQMKVFEDTEVEIHFKPTYMRCPWLNSRLQKWFKKFEGFDRFGVDEGITVPSIEFNMVFLLLHIFRHLLGEGVGLRQVMDYYYVLQQPKSIWDESHQTEVMKLLKQLRLHGFASGLMWVMQEVFGLKHECMLCEPDEKLGRLILMEIELSGNFGQHDERSKVGESVWKRFCRTNFTNLRFMRYFPEEVLCTPLYRVWHKCWQIIHGYQG